MTITANEEYGGRMDACLMQVPVLDRSFNEL